VLGGFDGFRQKQGVHTNLPRFGPRRVKTYIVGDIPNGYTSDVVLNQQARVAHQGGMVDCLPGGPVAEETMAVLDAGAYGRSGDRPMAGCLIVHA
jgi:hypothetical protein